MDQVRQAHKRTLLAAVVSSNGIDEASKPRSRRPITPAAGPLHRRDELELVIDGPPGILPPAAARALLQIVLAARASVERISGARLLRR